MRCENIIASTKKDFSILNMVTDSWIPACGVWVGDYPYLDRSAFREFISTVEPASPKDSIVGVPTDETSSESATRSSRQSLDTDQTGSSAAGKNDRQSRKNPEEKLDGVLLRRDQYSSPKRRR